jgi:hypothetical protein
MKILENLLDKLGISNRSMASFIGTSHTLINCCIASTRNLPTHAMLQLAQLGKLLKTLPAPAMPVPSPQEVEDMQQQAVWCLAQCHPLQKQLTKMQQTYQQAATLVQLLDAYAAGTGTLTAKQQRWVDEQRYQAKKRMVQNGWLPQQQLRHKITLLTYEAGLYKTAMQAA